MKNNRSSNKFIGISAKHVSVVFLLIFLGCDLSYGQLQLVPIAKEKYDPFQGNPAERTQASITLPFFDDFATTRTAHPSTLYWEEGSGVYVNNTLATSQPSLNMATFDGLTEFGAAYDGTNPLRDGNTDTLTSQPINLAGLSAKDSVYLSFYWLAKGLGEKPDSIDVFRLEFKDRSNIWTQVWVQDGKVTQDSIFRQQFVAISDAAYLHENFQFRFRSYGKGTGPFDTWHLDYVYLNKNRSVKQPYIADVAMRRPLTPFLKYYTAMPLSQYLRKPAAATTATIIADVKNNFDNPSGFNALSGTFVLSDSQTGHQYFTYKGNENVASLKSTEFKIPVTPIVPVGKADSLRLLSKFFMTTTDNKTPGVNLFRNDTITAYADFSDYYAFDDGSAEYGIQVNQKLGRAAVRFTLSEPDTIAGVRMSIIPFNLNVSGQAFNVQLWSNKDGKPDQMLAQRSVAAKYPDDRNGFVDYAFATAVAVKDTFYVGWLQINEQPVVLGYDRNSWLGKDQILFNLGSEWVKETELSGSIMIRPYVGGKSATPILGVEPVEESKNYFFPNPAQSIINWKNTSIKRIDIYSVLGGLMKTILPEDDQLAASLSGLENGIYLFKASDGKRSFIQKMLIVK
jgi:hypothetical protein